MDQETSVLLPAPYSKPVSAMAHLLSATTCYPRRRDGVHVREEEEEKNDRGKTDCYARTVKGLSAESKISFIICSVNLALSFNAALRSENMKQPVE